MTCATIVVYTLLVYVDATASTACEMNPKSIKVTSNDND